MTVPTDFPRSLGPAALAGAHPKISVRHVAGRYVNEIPSEELTERYEVCQDLAEQLAAYCKRKRREHPDWSRAELEHKLNRALGLKRWELSDEELRWCVLRAMERWTVEDDESFSQGAADRGVEGQSDVRR